MVSCCTTATAASVEDRELPSFTQQTSAPPRFLQESLAFALTRVL